MLPYSTRFVKSVDYGPSWIVMNAVFDRFQTIPQLPGYCIPACVEAAMKYLDPLSEVDQADLMERYEREAGDRTSISFGSIKEKVLDPIYGSRFSFDHVTDSQVGTWSGLLSILRTNVRNTVPTIASLPTPAGKWHMNVVLGYRESNDNMTWLLASDPEEPFLTRINVNLLEEELKRRQGRTDLLLVRRR
jgi:hypothetical protein